MEEKESRKRGWKGTRIESLEARVFKKKKGEDRRRGVSPRTRWPRGENKSRFCLTLDTHYIFLNIVRQDACYYVCSAFIHGEPIVDIYARRRGHLSQHSSAGNAPFRGCIQISVSSKLVV